MVPGGGHRGAARACDAVVHLVGETLVGRWTEHQREAIRESRVGGTRLLASALAGMSGAPKVLLCASATAIYGDRGDEELTERQRAGRGLPGRGVPRRRARPPRSPAGRDPGGAPAVRRAAVHRGWRAAVLLPLFRRGLGIRAGHGNQCVSWIALSDAVRAVSHVLDTRGMAGPVNVVAPNPVTNREYADTLASVLTGRASSRCRRGWRAWCSAPAWPTRCCWPVPECCRNACWPAVSASSTPTFEGALQNLLLAVTSDDER